MPKAKNQEIVDELANKSYFRDNLVYCRKYDLFYIWDINHYNKITNKQMNEIVWKHVNTKHSNINITTAFIEDLTRQLKWACVNKRDEDDSGYLALKDCYLNLKTFEFEDTNAEKLVPFYVPFFSEQLSNKTNEFDKFLKTTIVQKNNHSATDFDTLQIVQEMLGSILIDNMNASRAFFLVGSGANGKSTLIRVVQDIFGEENCSAMSIEKMTTNKFAVAHLIGKKVNMSNEEESKYIGTDKFKALVTGDVISGERKFGDEFEFPPKTKFIFATNRMPTFGDGSNYALSRRIIIIPFYKKFNAEERDYDMSAKLKKELPAILGWAVAGAKRLLDRNYVYSESKACMETMSDFEGEVSSAIKFFRDNYEADPAGFISSRELYENYVNWCHDLKKHPVNFFSFIKEIRENEPEVGDKTGRDTDGKIKRGMKIIKVNKVEQKFYEENFGVEGQEVDNIEF